jgi:hypothetical protein
LAFQVNHERTSYSARGLAPLTLLLAASLSPLPSRQVGKQLVLLEADLQRLPRKRVTVTDDRAHESLTRVSQPLNLCEVLVCRWENGSVAPK